MNGVEDLRIESQEFEIRHNSRYHYSLWEAAPQYRRWSELHNAGVPGEAYGAEISQACAGDIPRGTLHSQRWDSDVFGEHFQLLEEAVYEHVTATIDVAQERMVVDMGGTKMGEIAYRLPPES